nr:uncharacterized protein LOC109172115 [Ipomoea batatas]GME13840.1 uncharacterized protein LOC109172115 [Ipomoea batatas]
MLKVRREEVLTSGHSNEENSYGSRTVTDTFSNNSSKPWREQFGVQRMKWVPKNRNSVISRRVDPIQRVQMKEDCALTSMESEEDIIDLGKEDVFHIEEEKSFCLMGRFAGRYPGMKAIKELIVFWKVQCSPEALPNRHIIFRFLKEEDREAVFEGGPYLLYGKRLFLEKLQENTGLGFNEFCFMPTWVRFPELPISCWHKNALSKIASKIGTPICMDSYTKELRKGHFARVLIDINCSVKPSESVSLRLPDGLEFQQQVEYEYFGVFCSRCGSIKHFKASCLLGRVEENLKRRQVLDNQDLNLDQNEDVLEKEKGGYLSTDVLGCESAMEEHLQQTDSQVLAHGEDVENPHHEVPEKVGETRKPNVFGEMDQSRQLVRIHARNLTSREAINVNTEQGFMGRATHYPLHRGSISIRMIRSRPFYDLNLRSFCRLHVSQQQS